MEVHFSQIQMNKQHRSQIVRSIQRASGSCLRKHKTGFKRLLPTKLRSSVAFSLWKRNTMQQLTYKLGAKRRKKHQH